MLKITNSKNSTFQGQQKKVMGTKNVRKTKSYVTKEKNFKSVKVLQRNLENVFSKIVSFFANISKLKPKQQNAKGKSWSPRSPLYPLKIFTPKM